MKYISKATSIYKTIRQSILNEELLDGDRLPVVKALCARFNVSVRTVMSALAMLEKDGLLSRTRGSGTYVTNKNCSKTAIHETIESPRTKAEEIADDIIRDIVHGNLRTGDFLSIQKILQYRYNTSKDTMRSALKIAEKKGLILRLGSSFVVGTEPRPARSKLDQFLYIIGSPYLIRAQQRSRSMRMFIESFLFELNRYGIYKIKPVDVRTNPASLSTLSLEGAVGILALPNTFYHKRYEQLPMDQIKEQFKILGKIGLPVCLFSFSSLLGPFPDLSIKPRKNINLFMEDNIGAGEKVAAHLGGLGHKKVCIFGQYDDEYWCLTRIKSFEQGLKNLFREQAQVYRFLTKFDKLALRKGVNDNFISDEDKAMINGTISKAFGGYEFTHSDPSRIIRNEGWQLIQRDHSKAIMEPYFKEALSKKEVTAWVCTDDSITNAASEFLEKNNVSVPGDISLVGIDSNEFSIFYDTTFYDFRRSQIGYLAAHCILDDIPIKRNQMGLVDSPGRMIIRDSTRRIDG